MYAIMINIVYIIIEKIKKQFIEKSIHNRKI